VEELQGELIPLFLMFARIIAGSKLFIGNSSFLWTVAEALKVNRVMDVYHGYPNCLPQTSNGWTELSTDIIERCLSDKIGG
jgi:ADP-heptose:LPS heptosyltransferase